MFLFAYPMIVLTYAQHSALYYNRVDSLKLGERIGLRTNVVDWIMLTPNFGIEYTLGNKNWNNGRSVFRGELNWNTTNKRPYL